MRRALITVLVLAGAGYGAKAKLKNLLDPANKGFPLRAYEWEEWQTLDKQTKLRSKAIDPAEWADPPPDPPDPEEEKKKKDEEAKKKKGGKPQYPTDRAPGFRFDQRLRGKMMVFDELVDPASPSKLEGVIRQLKSIEKYGAKYQKTIDDATDEYLKTKGQLEKQTEWQIKKHQKKYGKPPAVVMVNRQLKMQHDKNSRTLQRLIAIQESDRQFHAWLAGRVAVLIGELTEEERGKPLAALVKGLQDKDWRYRLRCGDVLGRIQRSDKASDAFSNALEKEADPMVLAELIRLRALRADAALIELLAKRLEDKRWPVRAAVIRELGNIRKKEAVDILVAQLAREDGRLKDDVTAALRNLTHKHYGPEPDPWRIWWKDARAKWTPPTPKDAAKSDKESAEKGSFVYFYGIRTSSKRIVFCIDFSGSMSFPLDGQGGKKKPRIETARKQLAQALSAIPEDSLFNIVFYSANVGIWKKRMQPATLKNKQAARKFVEKQSPAGSTNIYDALMTSLDVAARQKKSKDKLPEADTIFFLTDGQPTSGRVVDPHQIIHEITERNKTVGVVIHTVGVSKEQNAAFLLNLAKRNGGDYAGHK